MIYNKKSDICRLKFLQKGVITISNSILVRLKLIMGCTVRNSVVPYNLPVPKIALIGYVLFGLSDVNDSLLLFKDRFVGATVGRQLATFTLFV